jgi:cell division protease FtsH
VMERTAGPNVDGRVYDDRSFTQMLEKYHAAVVRAHKEHGGVGTPIPVPVPPSPVMLHAEDEDVRSNGQRAAFDPSAPPRRPDPS